MNEVENSATVGTAQEIAEELQGYDVDLVVENRLRPTKERPYRSHRTNRYRTGAAGKRHWGEK